MTLDDITEIQQASEALLDLILTKVPHDPRVDVIVMSGRVVLGGLLSYLRSQVGK